MANVRKNRKTLIIKKDTWRLLRRIAAMKDSTIMDEIHRLVDAEAKAMGITIVPEE